MFAGEQCRVNGIYWAYHSKDDYNFEFKANQDGIDYDTFIKRRDENVNTDILSEAQFSWKNYYSLSAKVPDEYEFLKALL